MDLFFKSKKLASVMGDEGALKRAYGDRNAREIRCRLAVLCAVPSLAEVPRLRPERCHPLTGPLVGRFAVDVIDPFRLVFEPAPGSPIGRGGRVNLAKVTAIVILEIVDYH